MGRRAALQDDGRDAVRREQGGDGEKVVFELHAAAHRGALQLTDVRPRGCRPGRSVCCRPPDRATARRDPSAPSTATRSSRPGSAPAGPNGRPPPAGAWRGAQARSRRSSSVSATRMAAVASSRSRVGTSGYTSASRDRARREWSSRRAGARRTPPSPRAPRARRRSAGRRSACRRGLATARSGVGPGRRPPVGHLPLRRRRSSRARYPHAVVATGREMHTTRPFAAGAFRFMVAASDPEDAALVDSLFRDLPSPPASDEPPGDLRRHAARRRRGDEVVRRRPAPGGRVRGLADDRC